MPVASSHACLALALALQTSLIAQIPASDTLSPTDEKEFRQEIARLEQLKNTASDKCTVQYALARTWASGGQYRETLDALRTAIDLNSGLDPSNDRIFDKIRGSKEFRELLEKVRATTPPVHNSQEGFRIAEPGLFPEGIAYDPKAKRFYLGSMVKYKIIRCTPSGACEVFVTGELGEILGLKIDSKTNSLWVTSNTGKESGLFRFNLKSGKLIRKYLVVSGDPQPRHRFNDLAVSSKGDVFVTDTPAGAVYWISHVSDRLEEFEPRLKIEGPNGIALSADERKLYVAGFPDGITIVDLPSRSFRAIPHPPSLCLATIDGLQFYRDSLLAIQNGVMTHRVVRYYLNKDLDRIERFEILERRNPLFNGITTGAVAGDSFYYMANTQLDAIADGQAAQDAKEDPIVILKIPLKH
jgi:DNA-binding beta-propeller fold protein YncE